MNVENLELLLEKSKSLKILYVEDDDASRESTLQALNIFFEDITVADDGEEGYKAFNESKFDLIITDLNMPVLSGIEMIHKIRDKDSEITILILSADVSAESFTKTIRAGIEGYLLKPIDIEQFVALIKKCVNNILSKKEIEDYKENLEKKVQKQTKKLKDSLFQDNSTGLFNFLKLNKDIESGKYKTLILFDISHFSIITMQYGRKFADKLLVKISKTLIDNTNSDMRVYKIDTNRLAVVTKDDNYANIKGFSQQILAYYDMRPIEIDDVKIDVTLSIGIAFVDEKRDSTIDAEYALENAKKTGSRYYSFYNTNDDEMIKEQNATILMDTAKELICEDDIVPYYRAILDINADKIISYEVSARGVIDGELVKPSFFMNSAKTFGLMSSVTKIIIQKSFQFFSNNDYNFSIKITHRDLLEGYLLEFLKQKMKLYNIKSQRITLEILENISISIYSKQFEDCVESIKSIGVNIVFYDLGIENPSLTKLIDINLDFIKINGNLIGSMIEDEKAMSIVKHISSLAKILNIKIVAENIETQEVLDIAKEMGIDYAQGSFIGDLVSDSK